MICHGIDCPSRTVEMMNDRFIAILEPESDIVYLFPDLSQLEWYLWLRCFGEFVKNIDRFSMLTQWYV